MVDFVDHLKNDLVFITCAGYEGKCYHVNTVPLFFSRLLSAITCCLDTLICLQLQYSFQDLMLKKQQENILEGEYVSLL